MQWRYLFTRDNLNRGYDLYKAGCNSNVGSDNNGNYWNRVEGCLVEIGNYDKGELYTKCECRYAKIGLKCKHMAATFFAIEEMALNEAIESKKNKVEVHPFRRENSSNKYRYFDLEAIMENYVVYDNTYKKALELIKSNIICIDEPKTDYSSHYASLGELECIIGATIKGKMINNFAEIRFNNKEITKASCNCAGCGKNINSYYSYGNIRSNDNEMMCFHQLAALLLAKDLIEKRNPGDATDKTGMDLIKVFKKKRIANVLEESELVNRVSLVPRIEGPMLSLGFKIGKEKLYVVKSLADLVFKVENKERFSLGKNEELNFAIDQFDDISKKYYRIIKQVVKDEENKVDNFVGKTARLGSSIVLYGSRLDHFFKMFEGKKIETAKNYGNSINGKVKFEIGDIFLELETKELRDSNNLFQGIKLEGYLPRIIEGVEHRYYEDCGCVYRINKEAEEAILPFVEAANSSSYIKMIIGRKGISDFYHNVLPQINKYVYINDITDEIIENYIPPKAEYAFYLDIEETDIKCKAMVAYGEDNYYLTDGVNPDYEIEEIRNPEEEMEVSNSIEKIFMNLDYDKKEYFCNNDEDSIYYILDKGINDLLELGEVHTTEAFRKLKIKRIPKITVGVSVQSNLMDLNIMSEEISKEELLDILFRYRKKKKYYRLKNGDFINMLDKSIEELSSMVQAMHLTEKDFTKDNMKLPLYRALYMDKLIEENDGIYAKRDSYFKEIIKDFKTFKDSDFAVPKSLEGIMRKYQKHGFRWLKTLEKCNFGGILADDMGLGKTLQIISVLLSSKEQANEGTAIIISPASLIYNWKDELNKFAPQLSVAVIEGSQGERETIIREYDKYDVIVTSYDLLKRDISLYENCQFKYEIIDEAQYIKNHTTAAAKAVKVIKSNTRFALTGTPIENRLSELWSIFDYLMPGFLYTYENFKKELEIPISREEDIEAVTKLKKMVSPFILRRLKEDVLKDLPEKVEEVRYAVMDKEQQKIYDGQVVYMKELINSSSEESFAKSKIRLLAELTKIRQICCDPSLIFEDYKGTSAKRQACMELIKNAIDGNHRVLLFSQFTSMLDLLKEELKKENIEYYEITGATKKQERVRLVQEFNEGKIPIFLISLKAGGTGLNLVGADIVIHYDPWWNIAAQNQATDRAHRIGQTKSVSVYKLIVKNSIEEKILKLQEAKKRLAEEILMGEMGNISSLSKEELIELME